VTSDDLKAVFLEQRPMLIRLLVARLGSREEAEDVAQEMWLKLERRPDALLDHAAAYLFRMAANLATDRRIAATRAQARDSAWLEAQPGTHELPTVERAIIARQRLGRLEAAVAAMPERMRMALRMFRVEELPQREIADRLGVTVSAVEKLLRRAMIKIHDADQAGSADSKDRRRLTDEGSHD
jgi:RNA polymerase sigma-70 factor (ECF subfamily)